MKNSANLLVAVIAACVLALSSQESRANAVQEGIAAFDKGDFALAARSFDTALASGPKSAGLYYDLAIAQQKAGDRPQAALNFRRALALDPRLVEARMALSDLERAQGVALPPPTWRFWIGEHISLPVLMTVGSVIAWGGCFFLLYALFKRGRKAAAITLAIVTVVIGKVLFASGYLSDPRIADRHTGVLLEQVSLLSSASDQSQALSRLPACSPVTILRQSGEWTFCQSATGEKGWAPSAKIAAMVPSA